MGLQFSLETAGGSQVDTVADPMGILSRLLPPVGDRSFVMLSYIDRYGDTIFNRLQAEILAQELEALIEKSGSREDELLLRRVHRLAAACLEEPHRFVKVYGD